MQVFAHFGYFFLASLVAYWQAGHRRSNAALIVVLGLPIAGVILLGWWDLLLYFGGLVLGAKMFIEGATLE